MKKKQFPLFIFFAITTIILFNSCGSVKYEELLLLEDVGNEQLPIDTLPILEIQSDDIIDIKVASRNPETVIAFQQQTGRQEFMGASGEQGMSPRSGYRIDEKGDIYLPFVGRIEAAGNTISELREELTKKIQKYIPDASVQVRFLNFRVTVLGEVSHPNTYTIPNERLTILEAIGMAGDFTSYARRDHVLVIRQRDEKREFARLNAQAKTLFKSPYFYLSPNDIVYVEPLEAKKYATQGDFLQRYSAVIFPLVTLTTFLLGAFVVN